MRSAWLIARHEYRRVVLRRGFLLGTLAVPLGIVLLIGLTILVETMGDDPSAIGYVDRAGLLDEERLTQVPDVDEVPPLQSFVDETAARKALAREEIQAFFVLTADYPTDPTTALYYNDSPPPGAAWTVFLNFVRVNLLAEYPAAQVERILAGPEIVVIDTSSDRIFDEAAVVNIVLPFVATLFFLIATMSAANYMLQIVTDEKENRTMEMIVTATSPGQLMGGKISGLLAATLTQLMVYVIALAVGLIVARPYVPALQALSVPWPFIGLMTIFFLPAYALIAAVMVAVGSAVTEQQEGQQIGGILNLFFLAPAFITPLLFTNPGHPVLVFMTLFPTTAFLTVSLRWGLGTIPTWQIVLSWVLLVSSTVGMVWVAARLFRLGMLRYGQPLSVKGVWRDLRQAG